MSIEYEQLRIDALGHASVRIETKDGTIVYVDPWSEVLEDEPGDGDVVFVTHEDFDHYDPDGLEAVAGSDATIAVFEAVDTSDLDGEVVDLPYSGEVSVDGIAVETVPAYNDPEGGHVDDDGMPFHPEGEGIGLFLDLEGTDVFVPSDTDFLDHHESIDADVFLPPIGGHYTMDRREAADFARGVDPELVVPIHYDTFDAIETDAEAFVAELEDEGIRVETA